MFPDSPYAHPVGSFPAPVSIVDVDPDADPLVKICVNREWIPYIAGALKQLLLQSTWHTNDPNVLWLQQERVFNLFYIIGRAGACEGEPVPTYEEFVDMVAFRQDCDCSTFVKCCDGSEKELAFKSDIPAGGQPGSGATQPPSGGGTADYCAQLQASGKLYVPTVVNTGDVITLQVSGAGNDPDADTINWRCPDGEQFFAGQCVGFTTTVSTDPLPATPHMQLIANIDGTFHPFVSGSLTVPSGVSSGQVYIQVNDSNLTDNAGSYQICVTVQNNQSAHWTKDFDFTTSPGTGWYAQSGEGGHWSAGVGWVSDNSFSSGTLGLRYLMPTSSFAVTAWSCVIANSSGHSLQMYADHSAGGTTTIDTLTVSSDPQTHVFSSPGQLIPQDLLALFLTNVPGLVIQSCHFEGTGVTPF